MDDKNRGELAEYGEPTQPHQRVEPDILWPVMSPWQTKHSANVAIGVRLSK
jgi:hypothetical protein